MTGSPKFPTDSVEEDPSLPAGTVVIEVRDGNERPLPNTGVTVGKIQQSIAKGESRSREELTTGPDGRIVLRGQETGSGFAYRVSTHTGPATFAARPFNLPQVGKGVHVILHRFETTTSLEEALILTGLVVVAELRDDRIQLDEIVTVFNRGRTAWVPDDVILPLPETFTALVAQQSMSDQGVDSVPKRGARLKGTFPPGQHQVEFRWQLPHADPWKRFLGDGEDVSILVGGPPHLAQVQAIAAVGDSIKFFVEGFPPAVVRTGQSGDRLLVTQRELQAGDPPLTDVKLQISNIPGPGRGPLFATLATLALLALGLYAHMRREIIFSWFGDESVAEHEKEELLREIAALEGARAANQVGPKTYERAKNELRRALARVLARPASDD